MSIKSLIIIVTIAFFSNNAIAQKKEVLNIPDTTMKINVVEVSCGQCKFNMQGSGCELAVRIDGKPYFVDNTKIDEHGDAHAKNGFCESIRKAEVQGKIIDNRYKVSYFKLLP